MGEDNNIFILGSLNSNALSTANKNLPVLNGRIHTNNIKPSISNNINNAVNFIHNKLHNGLLGNYQYSPLNNIYKPQSIEKKTIQYYK